MTIQRVDYTYRRPASGTSSKSSHPSKILPPDAIFSQNLAAGRLTPLPTRKPACAFDFHQAGRLCPVVAGAPRSGADIFDYTYRVPASNSICAEVWAAGRQITLPRRKAASARAVLHSLRRCPPYAAPRSGAIALSICIVFPRARGRLPAAKHRPADFNLQSASTYPTREKISSAARRSSPKSKFDILPSAERHLEPFSRVFPFQLQNFSSAARAFMHAAPSPDSPSPSLKHPAFFLPRCAGPISVVDAQPPESEI
ncbi:hypothetical protein R3P38DRAFT_3222904 [Favolaschia claudopus]|uniref:Uncharacterized protein n=1 Tax=Favolaschia claudopus TaxID=2862362 RepID=A0AAV9ZXM2_9AGAR